MLAQQRKSTRKSIAVVPFSPSAVTPVSKRKTMALTSPSPQISLLSRKPTIAAKTPVVSTPKPADTAKSEFLVIKFIKRDQ
jgi:hypothetical protein